MKFNVQYSYPNNNRIAISEWIEKIRIVEAETMKEAVSKCNKLCQTLGTWMILDCWKEE